MVHGGKPRDICPNAGRMEMPLTIYRRLNNKVEASDRSERAILVSKSVGV